MECGISPLYFLHCNDDNHTNLADSLVELLSPEKWSVAYQDDLKTATVIKFVKNPGTIFNKNLKDAKLHASYCIAILQSHFVIKEGFLIYLLDLPRG